MTDYESVGLGFESLPGHQSIITRTPRQHFVDGVFEYIRDSVVIIFYCHLLICDYYTANKSLEHIELIFVVFVFLDE